MRTPDYEILARMAAVSKEIAELSQLRCKEGTPQPIRDTLKNLITGYKAEMTLLIIRRCCLDHLSEEGLL